MSEIPFPPHFGIQFTPNYHSDIPANINPTKVALPKPFIVAITGAGKGLGKHITLAFAKAGATGLAISSRTQSDLDTLTSEIKTINPSAEVLSLICDTQSDESVNQFVEAVKEKFGRLDTCVANAGIISAYIQKPGEAEPHLPVGLIDDGDWARVLNINLLGTWRIARAFLPLLIATKDGPRTLIVNSSLASHNSDSAFTSIAYNVSKLACNRLVEHVDSDHGPKTADGVCAYVLHPGAVLTPQTEGHTGEIWRPLLKDDIGLAGAFCVWLSRERREWLGGRYVSCNWDVEELEGMKERIVGQDLLKFRMVV